MIAFLMFFYFFIFVYLYVIIKNKKERSVIHIVTRNLSHYNDEMKNDKEESKMDNDYIQLFQVEMKTNKKDEMILYEFHSYLLEHNINEDYVTMFIQDDNILWDIIYSSNVYETFYDSLVDYINQSILYENLVVYFNGERI